MSITTFPHRRQVIRLIMICSLLCFAGVKAFAQTCTLQDAIHLALQNNKQLQNEKLNVTSAAYKIAEAKSAMLPHVDLVSQYQYYLDLPEQYMPASAFGGPEDQYAKRTMTMQQTMNYAVQVNQVIRNREMTARIESAKLAMDASILQTGVTKENIVYNVTATYYAIQVLQDNLARLAENIANLEQTVRINEVLRKNELIPDNVHQRLLINLENLQNEYENQKLNLNKNMSLLKYLIDKPMSDSLIVVAFDYDSSFQDPAVSDVMLRPDLKLQQAQIKVAEHELVSIRAHYAPVVNATFSSGFSSYNDQFAPYQQINHDWEGSSYISLNTKIPIFSGFQKKIQVSNQKVAIQRSFNTLALIRLNAEKEILDAHQNYNTHKAQFGHTKSSLDLAQKLFDTAQQDYANGLITITDLLNAQYDLTDARTNYSSALLQYKLAELSLQKAYGLL
ncbi:MAG TPA: TolC family protein, partial [Saprospiraceae bacterium]|nr:TolC family protein [Saprospiraceae bacterium]